jgi:hypothetical protein
MRLLSKAEELILLQFHERAGERVGAQVGQLLPVDAVPRLESITPGVDFDGALASVLEQNLMVPQGEAGYTLTQEGYDYLYTREGGHRVGEG